MWIGVRWKSLKTKTISKFFNPNCTRSKWAISISLKVMIKKGGSDKWTRQSVVGCNKTFDRNGTPVKPSSRNGTSTSIRPSLYHTQLEDTSKYNKPTTRERHTYSFWNLFGKWLEFTIEIGSSSSFFLFLFQFVLVTIQVPPSLITRLIVLDVWCFTVELDILNIWYQHTSSITMPCSFSYFGFLFADKDGVFEMDVDQH